MGGWCGSDPGGAGAQDNLVDCRGVGQQGRGAGGGDSREKRAELRASSSNGRFYDRRETAAGGILGRQSCPEPRHLLQFRKADLM